MKRSRRFTRIAALVLVLVLAAAAAGCNKKAPDVTNVTPVTDIPSAGQDETKATPTDAATPTEVPATPTAAPTAEPTATPTPEPTAEPTEALPEPPDGKESAINVSSIEELAEAIAPGAVILIEAGRYNVGEFVDRFETVEDIYAWNDEHEYVEFEGVYDGWQLVVKNVDGISIAGPGPDMSAVELVTDPRYAAILTFRDCNDISLHWMTMGHTDRGDCTGNVIDLIRCKSIYMSELDLYGCGVYGIGTAEETGDLYVSSSVIRDCTYGPFDIQEPAGDFNFLDCRMTGSYWGGSFDYNLSSQLSFYRCTFGEGESNEWAFVDHVYMEDCVFAEVSQYPDYGEEYPDYSDMEIPELELESVQQVPAGREAIAGTGWSAVYSQDVLTDQLTYVGMGSNFRDIAFSFYTDDYMPGQGWYCYDGDFYDLTWDITDDGMVRFETDSLGTVFGAVFKVPASDGTGTVDWLRVAIGDETFWLY